MPVKNLKKKNDKNTGQRTRLLIIGAVVLFVLCIGVALYLWTCRKSDPGLHRDGGGYHTNINGSVEEGRDSPQTSQAPLKVTKANMILESKDGIPHMKVVVGDKLVRDGKEASYRYEWTINGQSAGDGGDSLTGFKRGDSIGVRITPYLEDIAGLSRSLTMKVLNTPPVVKEVKGLKDDGKEFSCQVVATDEDGDILSYSLQEPADPEVTLDGKTGVLHWSAKDGKIDKKTIKIKVSDNKGGETTYTFDAIPASYQAKQ